MRNKRKPKRPKRPEYPPSFDRPLGANSELLTLEFDEEITDQDSILSMVGAASKRRPASE